MLTLAPSFLLFACPPFSPFPATPPRCLCSLLWLPFPLHPRLCHPPATANLIAIVAYHLVADCCAVPHIMPWSPAQPSPFAMPLPPAVAAPSTAAWWECPILTPTRSAELPTPLLKLAPPHGATMSVVVARVAGLVHTRHQALSHQGSAAVHAPQNTSKGHHRSAGKSGPAMACSAPDETDWSFFSPAQAHVGEPARYALVTTNTPSRNAMAPSCGMDPPV